MNFAVIIPSVKKHENGHSSQRNWTVLQNLMLLKYTVFQNLRLTKTRAENDRLHERKKKRT